MPHPPPSPARRLGRRRAVVAILVVGLAVGLWRVAVAANRAGDRREALDLFAAREYEAAVPRLEACLAVAPDDVEVCRALTLALDKTVPFAGDMDAPLDRLCRLAPDDPDAFARRARHRERCGRPDEALADYLRVVELRPGDAGAGRSAALLAVSLGRYEVSDRLLTGMLTAAPSRADLGLLLAVSYWERGGRASAEQTLARYVPADTTAAGVLRGVLHVEAGRYDEAVATLRAARPASARDQALALHHLGMALDRLGRADESRKAFDELAAVQRAGRAASDAAQRLDHLPSYVLAARAYLDAGNPAEGARLLQAAVGRLGRTPEAMAVLADCLDRAGRPAEAAAVRQAAVPR